jgi:trehalose 6-phosphate phosphatase
MIPLPQTAPPERLLAPLRESPQRTAVLCDVDGTLAPIAAAPDQAAVPDAARAVLEALARRYAVVGCVSGRRATEARAMVGLDSLTYIGNHGLERLAPGAAEADMDPAIRPLADRVREFATAHLTAELEDLRVALEDKYAIWSFHYRQARDEAAARAALEQVASAALEQGLFPHWGRMVLEIRPTDAVDKGTAIAALLRDRALAFALYGGDDVTDLDAFRKLRSLSGVEAVCVGVASDEGPSAIATEADLVVDGPEGFRELLEILAVAGE